MDNRDYRILVLEPHIDDLELGCSVLLEKLIATGRRVHVHVITFCVGRKFGNPKRKEVRAKNLAAYNELGNFSISWETPLDYNDTFLDDKCINKMVGFIGEADKINNFNLLLIPQSDCHRDHRIVNEIGKIAARETFPKVMEYIIMNSFPAIIEKPIWNTIYVSPNNKKASKRALDVCLNYSDIGEFQAESVLIQKREFSVDGPLDRFNVIKNIVTVK
jgi:LmbE family N-acetylglucosaminyl deacetylase